MRHISLFLHLTGNNTGYRDFMSLSATRFCSVPLKSVEYCSGRVSYFQISLIFLRLSFQFFSYGSIVVFNSTTNPEYSGFSNEMSSVFNNISLL